MAILGTAESDGSPESRVRSGTDAHASILLHGGHERKLFAQVEGVRVLPSSGVRVLTLSKWEKSPGFAPGFRSRSPPCSCATASRMSQEPSW